MKNNKLLTALMDELVQHKKLMYTFKEMHATAKMNDEDAEKTNELKNFYLQHLTAYFGLKDVVKKAYGEKTAKKVLNNI
jgi:NADPH-dependent curcumin reductase CurA